MATFGTIWAPFRHLLGAFWPEVTLIRLHRAQDSPKVEAGNLEKKKSSNQDCDHNSVNTISTHYARGGWVKPL